MALVYVLYTNQTSSQGVGVGGGGGGGGGGRGGGGGDRLFGQTRPPREAWPGCIIGLPQA